ncbi:MAG: hypothetical protein GEU74_02700 [Nitriliruptorales bacterium]|nr:hypothetical protein [Nitriliruptorales bacterium]
MTGEAGTTWALVVGIDRYDDPSLASLDGAVADAVDAVTWLRALGVPDEQILLHASPSEASKGPLDALGVPFSASREPDIWASVHRLTQVRGGTRLFVFLSGHGLYEPTKGRLFLTQEAGALGTYNNLGIDLYVRLLLSTGFTRTFLFMDGCQNYPYTETKRQQIDAAIYGGVVPPTPRPGNSLAAAFAAKQGQRAAEINGRGAFLHRLLQALDITRPFPDALDLDFASGRQSLDLRRVISDDVRPAVERAAGALTPPVDQSPQLVPYGALGADDPCPVLMLPDVETGVISIDLAPVDASSVVDTIELQVMFRPWSQRLPRPRGTPLSIPITARVPVGEHANIRCLTASGTPWDVIHPTVDVPVTGEHPVHFELSPRDVGQAAGESEPPAQHQSVIGVKTLTHQGGLAPALGRTEYEQLGRTLGSSMHDGAQVAPGVHLNVYESGPEFVVDRGAEAAAGRVAAVAAEVLRDVMSSDVIIATDASSEIPAAEARVEVLLGEHGAAGLAGPLARRAVLEVDVPGDETVWETVHEISLAELEREGGFGVPPGRVRLSVNLPWGSWRKTVDAHVAHSSVVQLPTQVGAPPLRVRLGAAGWPGGYAVVGGAGDAPPARARPGVLATSSVEMRPAPGSSPGWVLTAADNLAHKGHDGGWMASVGVAPATVFPLSPVRSLAIDALDAFSRVEPLTDVPLPEWDMLVCAGRIEDIDPDGLTELLASASVDEVLGLAAAHALHGRRQWKQLAEVLDELRRREWLGLDVDLLATSLATHTGGGPDSTLVERLAARAARGEVPILRWGVALALQFCPDDDLRFGQWRAALQRIDATLSPRSVWTVWTE